MRRSLIGSSFALFLCALAMAASAGLVGESTRVRFEQPAVPPHLDAGVEVARSLGCISIEILDTQNIDNYTVQFRVETANGLEIFTFGPTQVVKVDGTSGSPLATREQTVRWTKILDSLERAAVAGKPLLIDYEVESRRVFGFSILWDGSCPLP